MRVSGIWIRRYEQKHSVGSGKLLCNRQQVLYLKPHLWFCDCKWLDLTLFNICSTSNRLCYNYLIGVIRVLQNRL